MELIKYRHACVRLDSGQGVLVIDPGAFTEREALRGADAVLITHEHFDHLDVDAVLDEYRERPALRVFAHPDVAAKLAAIAPAVTAVQPGDAFETAGFSVRAVGGIHEEIHSDIPRVANVGYLIDDLLYHPGDALFVPEATTVDTLLVPVSAPWLRAADAVDFVRAVRPRQAIAIHDALYTDTALGIIDGLFNGLARAEYRRFPSGEGCTVA